MRDNQGEKIITLVLILVFVAALILMGTFMIARAFEKNLNSVSSANAQDLDKAYTDAISQKSNVNELAPGLHTSSLSRSLRIL